MTSITSPDVIIAGAGPIGMTLALELASRGVRTFIAEKTDCRVETPKLGAVSIRTMEIFRRLNLSDYVRNTPFKRDYGLSMVFCTTIAGHLLGRLPYPSINEDPPVPVSPEKKWRCSQLYLNPLLEKVVRASPLIELSTLTRFDTFKDTGHEVVVNFTNLRTEKSFSISAPYLVGCDGPGSNVRRQLDIKMSGRDILDQSVAIFFKSAALATNHKMGEAERYYFLDGSGWWGNISAMDGKELWRLTVPARGGDVREIADNASSWVARALGTADIPFEVISALPWRRTELIAGSFGSGRVYIAGDSAHTMSPTGGFGMNTGMGDIDNLGWKLQAIIAGWGGKNLLSSYTVERQPIGIRNSAASTQNYLALKSVTNCEKVMDETPGGEAVRREVGRAVTTVTRNEWETLGLHLGYRYEGSPIVIQDGTDEPVDDLQFYHPTARPGHRAPHAWLTGGPMYGVSTLDLFGLGFVLLRFGSAPPDVDPLINEAEVRQMPLRVHDIDNPRIEEAYQNRLVLVRPDGHVAWRGDKLPADVARLVDVVRGAM